MPTPTPVPVAGQLILASWGAAVTAELAAIPSRFVVVPTAWTALPLTGGWVNFGSGYQDCQYRKIGDVVQLRGHLKNGAIGAPCATLPVGFRPPAVMLFAADQTGNTHGRLQVHGDGNVICNSGSNTNWAMNCEFSTVT